MGEFTAAQAAQKQQRAALCCVELFTAAQAAQKDRFRPQKGGGFVHCRTGSSEKTYLVNVRRHSVHCRTGSSETTQLQVA